MSLTTRMLLALAAGLAAGVVATIFRDSGGSVFLSITDPIGSIWINALRMTLIPLVVSLLISVVGSVPDARSTGRLGLRAFVIFVVFLAATGVVSILLGPMLVAMLPITAATIAALQGSDAAAIVANAARMPSVAQTIVDIVPSNPVRAAADGTMLPLVVFALALGAAATRVPPQLRAALIGFFRGLADAMLVLVGWVIALAPIGVFALAAGLAAKIGLAAVGVIAWYIVILSGVIILTTILLYIAAVAFGRVPLSQFARAVAPGQAVAFSARSSLAALPALVEGARTRLALPPVITSFVLPLAVSTLRLSSPIMWAITLPFLARLYGVGLGYTELVALVVAGILLSFSIPGLPSASLFMMAPFLSGLGIPAEALGIVIAADAIPDLFKGVLNVTGHMASATIVARHVPDEVMVAETIDPGVGAAVPVES
jgi:Na+/H+-dicarboxylate symporter